MPQPRSSPTSWLPQKQNMSASVPLRPPSRVWPPIPPVPGLAHSCAPASSAGQLLAWPCVSLPHLTTPWPERGFMDTLHQAGSIAGGKGPPQGMAPPHPPACLTSLIPGGVQCSAEAGGLAHSHLISPQATEARSSSLALPLLPLRAEDSLQLSHHCSWCQHERTHACPPPCFVGGEVESG